MTTNRDQHADLRIAEDVQQYYDSALWAYETLSDPTHSFWWYMDEEEIVEAFDWNVGFLAAAGVGYHRSLKELSRLVDRLLEDA